MCECISWWIKQVYNKEVSPTEIWNISPTGELYTMYALFWEFEMWLNDTKMEIDNMGNITFVPKGIYDNKR